MKSLLLHWVTGGTVAVILSALARALEPPEKTDTRLYRFGYRFAQNMLANFDLAAKAKER
jgi:hypothetical protein